MATQGLKGNLLPNSEADFADNYDAMKFKRCLSCNNRFSNDNVQTLLGWRETQISGFCERCFDNFTSDDETA